MTHAALLFALSAALLLGALLTLTGAVALAQDPRIDGGFRDPEFRPVALAIGVFGLLTFIAAASAILATIGAP